MCSDISSLEELCFNNISDNISNYISWNHLTTDENFKKSLLFLKRRYTQELFDKLEKNKTLKEEHLHFLLNQHLKILDITLLLTFLKKEVILEKVIPLAQNVQELRCINPNNTYDSRFLLKRLIPHFSNVMAIYIRPICTDYLLKLMVSSCPTLTELDIGNSAITSKGIKALYTSSDGLIQPRCPIKRLHLFESPLTINDVAVLIRSLPTLEEVLYDKLSSAIVSSCSLNIKFFNILKDDVKYNFKSLDFYDYKVPSQLTRALTVCSKMCPKVKQLDAEVLSLEHLDLIRCFPELEDLTLIGCDLSLTDMNDFLACKGKELKRLSLSYVSLSLSTLVDNCPNLEALELGNIYYEKKVNDNSSKLFNKLCTLTLKGSQDIEEIELIMKLLNSSSKLEKLSFECTGFFEDAFLKELLEFAMKCNLKHLEFSFSDVDINFIKAFISNCSSIETLTLDCCVNIISCDVSSLTKFILSSNRKVKINYIKDSDSDDFTDFVDSDEDEWEHGIFY